MSGTGKDRGKDTRKHGGKPAAGDVAQPPDWATGLRRLYDSVVEEPLPDSFKDLLSRLDDSET
jgi:hypothetical protein